MNCSPPDRVSRYTLQILLLAILYSLLGLAGLELAIPPGYASAIFPAAGVAVGFILCGGLRLLPGIWLGSLFINSWVFHGQGALDGQALVVASAMAVGPVLQAWLTIKLVGWKLPDAWERLDRDRHILWFLIIAGPGACLISASWGNSILGLAGVIGPDQYAFSWWNWWIGDTIGVLLFAPLTLMLLKRDMPVWQSRMKIVGVTTLVAMALILGAFVQVSKDESEQLRYRIEQQGNPLFSHVRSSIRSYSDVVNSLASFVQAMPDLNYRDFSRFTRAALANNPNLQALSWNPLLQQEDRAGFEAAMAEEMGIADFRITRKGEDGGMVRSEERDRYVVVRYILPLESNRPALGYDIASNRDRRAAIETALSAGRATLTEPIRLVQEHESSAGVLLLKPVFPDRHSSVRRDSRHVPLGFAVGVLRIESIIRGAVATTLPRGLVFRLDDLDAAPGTGELFSSLPDGLNDVAEDFVLSSEFLIGGRTWRMKIYPTQEYLVENLSLNAWGVLAAGLSLVSFLQAMLLGITGRTTAIRRIVEEQTRELSEKERFLRLSQENGRIATWEVDRLSDKQVWSRNCAALLGLINVDELSWSRFLRMVLPEDRHALEDLARSRVDDEVCFDLQFRLLRGDAVQRWMRATGQIERDAGGRVNLLRGVIQDIHTQKTSDEKLQLANLVYQNCSEGMVVTDADNRILAVNPSFTRITGYTLQEVLGKDPSLLTSGRQSRQFYQNMWQSIDRSGYWQGELWNRTKSGQIYAERLTINTIHDEDGNISRHVALFSDVTEKKNADNLIWTQANYDELTGLPNRRLFNDRLEQEIKKAHREGKLLAVLFIDLDHFKEVNDTLGHDVGDELLVEAAQRIGGAVRESDTVARLGGDEFTVILSDLREAGDSGRIAGTILASLVEPFYLSDGEVYVSASIGVTHYPDDAESVTGLLKNADQAMYQAKKSGRNRIDAFSQDLDRHARQHLCLSRDMRRALSENQLLVYYQPIVELESGRVVKAEALMRWRHPQRGMIPPSSFIPIAEENGLIHEMGDWVYRESVRQVLEWRKLLGADFQVSINKSPLQFDRPVATQWIDYLLAAGGAGKNIVIEITEGLLLDSDPATLQKLLQYRDSGIQVAIDDFGTGYSALAYLNRFDIDYLKIDRSFIRNLHAGNEEFALCEAIVAMAHKLGLKVIAEGIETEGQRDLLSGMGCDYGQGYLISRPLPPADFERLLCQSEAVLESD